MIKKSELLTGLFVGAAVGVVVGVFGAHTTTNKNSSTYSSNQSVVQRTTPQLQPDDHRNEKLNPSSALTLENKLNKIRHERSELEALLKEAELEREALVTKITELELLTGEPHALTDDQVNTKAKELHNQLKMAIETNDQKAMQNTMAEFAQIEPHAANEYFDAIQMLLDVSNRPRTRKTAFTLTHQEIIGLVEDDLIKHVLESGDPAISQETMSLALSVAPKKKVPENIITKAMLRLLSNPDTTDAQYARIKIYFSSNPSTSALAAYSEELSLIILNPLIPAQRRVLALLLLMDSQGAGYDYSSLAPLSNEHDPDILEAADVLSSMLNPTATGVFVIQPSIWAGFQVDSLSKLRAKDIVVGVDGMTIRDEEALWTALSDPTKRVEEGSVTLSIRRESELHITSMSETQALMLAQGGARVTTVVKR